MAAPGAALYGQMLREGPLVAGLLGSRGRGQLLQRAQERMRSRHRLGEGRGLAAEEDQAAAQRPVSILVEVDRVQVVVQPAEVEEVVADARVGVVGELVEQVVEVGQSDLEPLYAGVERLRGLHQ